jgi:hypothetical protein
MSRELSLVVRPFDDAYEDLWDSLSATVVKSSISSYADGEHRLSVEQLAALSNTSSSVEVDLQLNEISELVEPLGLDLDDLRLSVRTFSKYMNLSDLVFSAKLSELGGMPMTIQLDGRDNWDVSPLFAHNTGFLVQVAITLDVDRVIPENSLAPRHRHTILSECRFSFVPSTAEGNGLEIRRLNEESRIAERVPKNSSIYIKRIESPVSTNRLNDVLAVYVDSRLLDRISARKGSGPARFHIAQIGVAILTDIVLRSSIELNQKIAEVGIPPKLEDLKRTVTGKLIEMLLKKGQAPGYEENAQQLLDELVERPERTLSRVQAVYSHQPQALESLELEENQS